MNKCYVPSLAIALAGATIASIAQSTSMVDSSQGMGKLVQQGCASSENSFMNSAEQKSF